jgi:hypothetical protein
LVLSQSDQSPRLQKKHEPHAIANGTTTRLPIGRFCTSRPQSITSPMNSWPRMSPRRMVGFKPL